ncbi:ceramide synthase 2-like [Palaemon carinicauda]|uniref:ceramide synthase 2-like n=1 Tax=Palaemon carinicauda TaxID=392227 RepID=UPI0035B6998B
MMSAVKSYVDVFISPSTQQYIVNDSMVGIWWHKLTAKIWATDLWLPKGLTWHDLQSTKEFTYPDANAVFIYPLLFSVVIILLKFFILDPFILIPIATSAGIANKKSKPPPTNKTLEKLYKNYGTKPPQNDLVLVAQELEVTQRYVERWLRLKRNSERFTKYGKFVDCGFHLVGHTVITIYGLLVLSDKPWLWEIDLCWKDYPRHNITPDLWWYYMIGLSYYWASTFFQMFSIGGERSDAVQMMLHHFSTVILIAFSWVINFVRVGTLILLVHECADIPLIAAKMCKYAGIDAPTDILFVIFLLVWLYTRCYLYPFWILHSIFFEAPILHGIPVVIFCKGLVLALMVLNLIWTGLIARIIIKKFTGGSLEDIRSDADDVSDDDLDDVKRKGD